MSRTPHEDAVERLAERIRLANQIDSIPTTPSSDEEEKK